MKKLKVKFPGAQSYILSAVIDMPNIEDIKAFSILAHCFTCTKNLKAINNIAGTIANSGIGVLRFDFTGLGESEGDFSDTNFSSNIADLYAATKFLEENFQPPSLLIGHSLGGAAVLQAAHNIKSCKAVATIGAPSNFSHLKERLMNKKEDMDSEGSILVNIGGSDFRLKRQFFDDLDKNRMEDSIKKLGAALCILHSPKDRIVGLENAGEIFMAAGHPKSFVSLDSADHLMSNPDDSRYAGEVIASWASRYI